MSTTVDYESGTGINSWYSVKRDGVKVAYIERNANRGWHVRSIYYSEILAWGRDSNNARAKALALEHYPTETEVYEKIAARIEHMRRSWKTASMAQSLADAARDLANGSNSAQDRLIEIHNEIEAYARDRSDIGNQQYLDGTRWVNDKSPYAYLGGTPTYPKPPEQTTRVAS